MTVIIEVKPEIAQRWQEIAAREGRALETLLAEAMEERAAMLESEREYSQGSQAIRFSRDRATRNAQIRSLVTAPPAVRDATLRAGAEAAAPYYAASLQNGGELTEMSAALQDEDFQDD